MDSKSSSSRSPTEAQKRKAEQLDCEDEIQSVFEDKRYHELQKLEVKEPVPRDVSTTGRDMARPYKAAGHGQPSSGFRGSSQFLTNVGVGRGHGKGPISAYSGLYVDALTKIENEMLWHETLDVLNEMYAAGDLHQSWAPTLRNCYEQKWKSFYASCAAKESKTRQ